MPSQPPSAGVRKSFWQRFVERMEPYARAIAESPTERLWDRVDRLEREVERQKTQRRTSN